MDTIQPTYGFVDLSTFFNKKRTQIKDKIKDSINAIFNENIQYLLQIDDLNKMYQLNKSIDITPIIIEIENKLNNKGCTQLTLNPFELKTYNDIISIIKLTNKTVNKNTTYNEQLKLLKKKIIDNMKNKCVTINKLNKQLYYKNYKKHLEKNKKIINLWKKKYSIIEAFKYGGLYQYVILSLLTMP